MMSLIHLDSTLRHPSMFSGDLQVVQRLLGARDRRPHLWADQRWIRLTRGWAQPHRQHDVAEFLRFVTGSSDFEVSRVALPWQARAVEEDDRVQITDMGLSVPLELPPPCEVGADNVTRFTVQSLVQHWHNQRPRHASLVIPPAIILQVGRFHYDTTRGRATKRRYRVIPDPYIQFPVLDSGVRCRDVTLRLNSMVIHLGEAPTHGHYRSLLFDHLSCTYWLTDDGVAPVEMDSDRFQTFGSDVYLLIYQQ